MIPLDQCRCLAGAARARHPRLDRPPPCLSSHLPLDDGNGEPPLVTAAAPIFAAPVAGSKPRRHLTCDAQPRGGVISTVRILLRHPAVGRAQFPLRGWHGAELQRGHQLTPGWRQTGESQGHAGTATRRTGNRPRGLRLARPSSTNAVPSTNAHPAHPVADSDGHSDGFVPGGEHGSGAPGVAVPVHAGPGPTCASGQRSCSCPNPRRCQRSLADKKGAKAPKFAIANGLAMGHLPTMYASDMTTMEFAAC